MKTYSSSNYLVTLLFASAFGMALVTGCGDDDDEGSPSSGGRAGTSGSGVGGVGGVGGASQSGAGGAGQGGAAGGGGQLVSVRDYDGRRPGVDVLVNDGQGALVAHVKTGDDGTVVVAPPEGGSVSLVYDEHYSSYAPKRVSTYYGLDGSFEVNHFIFDRRGGGAGGAAGAAGAGGAPPPTTMRVRVTPSAPGPAPAKFTVALRCESDRTFVDPGATFERAAYGGCGDDKYDVLVMALDAKGDAIAYGTVLDAPWQPGGDVTHPVVVDKTDLVKHQYSAQAPEGWTTGWLYIEGARGDESSSPDLLAQYADDSSPSGTFSMPSGLFRRWSYAHLLSDDEMNLNNVSRSQSYHKDVEGAPADVSWSTDAVALVDAVTLDLADAIRPSFSWQLSPQGSPGDRLTFTATWSVGEQEALAWEVEMPPARSASLRMIELPEALVAYRPSASVQLDYGRVYLRELTGVDGWLAYQRDQKSSDEFVDSDGIYYYRPESGPARAGQGSRRTPRPHDRLRPGPRLGRLPAANAGAAPCRPRAAGAGRVVRLAGRRGGHRQPNEDRRHQDNTHDARRTEDACHRHRARARRPPFHAPSHLRA
jgi:hypothetical protein